MTTRPEITPELAARGFLSESQVRKILNVSDTSLRQWRHLGQGPKYVKIGRCVYYRASDVDTWLDAQAVTPTPKAAPSRPMSQWGLAGMSRSSWYRAGKPAPDQAEA